MAGVGVRKRGSTWEYRLELASVHGKRSQYSKSGFATKKAALEAGTKELARYNASGVVMTSNVMSVNDYLDHWMDVYCRTSLKRSTIENYEKNIRLRIKPAIGKYYLDKLTTAAMQKVIDDLFNQGYSRNTLSTVRQIMSGACRYAFETDKLIASNPALFLRMPSLRAESDIPTRNKPNIFIPASMITRIFERFPEGTSAFLPMQLGYRCGMRLGEAFGVLWDDIDLQARKINIQRQIQWDKNGNYWYFTNPKYDSVRSIDIDSQLYDILVRAYNSQHRAEQYYGEQYTKLFSSCNNVLNCSGDGKLIHPVAVRENGDYVIPRTMQHVSGVIHHELNFPEFTFHSLRHTHATMLIASGAPLKYVQERMGHKNIDVTLRVYTHMSSAQEQQGIDALETVFAH